MVDQTTKKNYVKQPNSPSFFDDNEPNAKFEFIKALKSNWPKAFQKPPIDCSSFKVKNLATGKERTGYFGLYDKYIAYCLKMNTTLKIISYLQIDMCILSPKLQKANEFSFTISKNCVTFEFMTNSESIIDEWLNSMKLICIHYNFHEEYKALKMIGKGSFARVYLVENNQSKIQYAVKACSKDYLIHSSKNFAKASVLNEIQILRELHHENIMYINEVFETENSLYMVIELIKGKTLEETISKSGKFTDTRCKEILKQLLEVLAYLSSKKIMHRDIKPDNILIDDNDNIKIVDFGLAASTDSKELIFDKCGTPGYIAPEIFKYNPNQPKTMYDEKCDVFSVGCIFYYMLYKQRLFQGKKSSEILASNKLYKDNNGGYQTILAEYSSSANKISQEALSLLLRLLESDPHKRITALEALEQPYMKRVSNNARPASNSGASSSGVLKKINLTENEAYNRPMICLISPKNNNNIKSGNETPSTGSRTKHQHQGIDTLDAFKSSYENPNNCHEKLKNLNLLKSKPSIYLNNDPPLINGLISTWESDYTPDSKSNSNYSTPINHQLSTIKTTFSSYGNSPTNDINGEFGLLNSKKKNSFENSGIKAMILKNIQKNFDLIKNDKSDTPSHKTHQYPNIGFSDYLEQSKKFDVVEEEESEIAHSSSPDKTLNSK